MAEKFIFSIAGQLLGKLSSPIIEEISLAWGVRDDIRRLENTVSCVHAVLLDAQERQASSNQLKNWLEKLEDALYRAQDVLEEFEIDALRYKVCDRTILRKVRREFSLSNRIIFRFKMSHKIEKIRGEFDDIAADRNKFNLIERFDERIVIHREMTHSFVRDGDVIGRGREREAVIMFLMATTDDESVAVLPIIGLGGIGKTTIAKLVYNEKRVVEHFDLRIWVCISVEFDIEKVIKEILKSAGVIDCDNLPLEQLQKCLRCKLENRKYLLILDDVWNENHIKWIDLRNLLIGGAKGCKIIITTRNKSVASIMATTDVQIEVQSLSHEECLSLFLKWAFRSSEDVTRYPHLVEIARSIVKKCKGVPLAVKNLGSILYTKNDESEWINVRDNEIWKIEQKEDDIFRALKLSYYQLPTNLRRCFAFCSIFPKDCMLNNILLTKFWHANGLLEQIGDNQDMDNIGMTYIRQLQSRGFFQDFDNFGTVVRFKMHDFVHDLALLVAGRECINLDHLKVQTCSSSKIVRHVSFPIDYFSMNEIPSWLLEQKENVHTFAFLDRVGVSKTSFVKACVTKFKSLRLLDLRDSSFEVLPSSIGSMKHLKYLDLSYNHRLKALPSSICELVGLETLEFNGCSNLEKLPRGIGQLIRLRSLGITTKEVYLPEKEIQCLTSLQHLSIVSCQNLKVILSDNAMQCLSSLRTLLIRQCPSLVSLPVRGLCRLTRFEALYIWDCENIIFTMDNISESIGLRGLQSLSLVGLPKLESLPLWLLHGANNMKYIAIGKCVNLTNLMPESILVNLKSVKKLNIVRCPKLKFLPEEMRSLTALNRVRIAECPELENRCRRGLGEDWHKICHVPDIYLSDIKI